MAARGEVVAAVHSGSGSECLLQVRLPATGKASDNILELKKQTMAFMTDFMAQKNMSTEEVDLMEEVVSDGGEEGSVKPGKKRKPQHEAPTT